MAKLTTATGKEFGCDYFNPFPATRQTNIRILNSNVTTIAKIFSNPEETKELTCDGQYASMYTVLKAIVPEDGAIRVVLEKR